MTSSVEMGLDDLCERLERSGTPTGNKAWPDALLKEAASALRSLRQDAERWRWLRTRINWSDVTVELSTGAFCTPTPYRVWAHHDYRKNRPSSEHIDEYIDSCLQADKGAR